MSLLHDAVDDEVGDAAEDGVEVPQLTASELLALRKIMAEFSVIRATCPMAVRALSTRK